MICSICGKAIEDSKEIEVLKGKKVHRHCMYATFKERAKASAKHKKDVSKAKKQTKIEVAEQKNVGYLNEGLAQKEETKEKKAVYEYVKQLTGTDVTVKTKALLTTYINKYNMKYPKILLALKYHYEICENPPYQDCVGILPYIYDEALRYYASIEAVHKVNADAKTKYAKTRAVISNPAIEYNDIDISAIGS